MCMCCAVLRLSVLSDAVILWTVARQAPLSMRILQAIILEWVAMTSSRGIFPIQGLNPGLPHCRQILYHLNHQGSPRILEWVVYPFSRGSSQPMNQTGVSCLAGGFFTSWATTEAHVHVHMCLLCSWFNLQIRNLRSQRPTGITARETIQCVSRLFLTHTIPWYQLPQTLPSIHLSTRSLQELRHLPFSPLLVLMMVAAAQSCLLARITIFWIQGWCCFGRGQWGYILHFSQLL